MLAYLFVYYSLHKYIILMKTGRCTLNQHIRCLSVRILFIITKDNNDEKCSNIGRET